MIKSHLDGFHNGKIHGWILDTENPRRIFTVLIHIDGHTVASCQADGFRGDLESIYGTGNHEFEWEVPSEWMTGRTHQILVSCPDIGSDVHGGPLKIKFPHEAKPGDDFVTQNLVRTAGPGLKAARSGVALLAINERFGALTGVHKTLIAELRAMDFDIVLINSTPERSEEFCREAERHVDQVLIRRDHGRDFSSWMVAFWHLREELARYPNLLLINDSMFGPYRPMAPVMERIRASRADIVGLTDSWETNYHLQSYFVMFKNGSAFEDHMRAFVREFAFPNKKEDVIAQGEVALGKAMSESGLGVEALFPYEEVAAKWLASYSSRIARWRRSPERKSGSRVIREGVVLSNSGHSDFAIDFLTNVAGDIRHLRPLNPTHFFWDTLITEFAFPFVKRELLTLNPSQVPNVHDFASIVGPLTPRQRGDLIQILRRASKLAPPPSDYELSGDTWSEALEEKGELV